MAKDYNANEPEDVGNEGIVHLNLNIVNIYGWEVWRPRDDVEKRVARILAGHDFPPVHLLKIDDLNYQLIKKISKYPNDSENKHFLDGGHRRSIAYYLANKPIPAIIDGTRDRIDLDDLMPVNIKNIELREYKDTPIERYKRAIQNGPPYNLDEIL